MKKRGFTVVELVLVAFMTTVLVMALSTSFSAAASTMRRASDLDKRLERGRSTENRLTTLLQGAYVSTDIADTLTYFVASNTSGSAQAPDTLVFTTTSAPVDMAAMDDTDNDWQTKNELYGPQGGLTEVSLSLTPVGADATAQGLYIRTQTPADGDRTQGGYESLLLDKVTQIQFEFWNGTDWSTTWDTTTGTRRIPALVRITYTVDGEATSRMLTVRLDQSDVTTANPVQQL
ncbi:MAG: hypothetical protein JSS65_05540 [Armatimonadetes bacterium]|nr:hypothetical protein [Armatimonadota bacterium]